MAIIKFSKDPEEGFYVSIIPDDDIHKESVEWQSSEELKSLLKKELEDHLGGEFADDFDPAIIEALEMFN